MVTITDIVKGSLAARAGVRAGDILISVNGHDIRDVLDYRFYLAESRLTMKIHRGPELFDVSIRKGVYDDIGLEFATALMDEKRSCRNKCMFCFIDQLPPGMRESLYFKDDDSRLSFLHGNYITLTNLTDEDIDRILEMHISPINISVHTTNPALRVLMMKNKRAGEVLGYIRRLADGGIKLHGQIVLCRGVNDGAELDRTMRDLAGFYPALESVSVVPAGLTAYREGLYPLEPFSPEETASVIEQVTAFGDLCEEKHDARIFYCADEMYVRSGVSLPPYEFWGDFTQIENGVGMLSSFEYEFEAALRCLTDEEKAISRTVSVATGEAAYAFICSLVEKLEKVCPDIDCRVHLVKNTFFGGYVTVAGLLTGQDLMEQLKDAPLGDELLLSRSTLRAEGDVFLCNSTPDDVADALSVPLTFVGNDGGAFLDAILGIGADS
ncbi:MAG: DUF512 domain-containing protein [Clostridia bacterium]|nr:DUF512 domain-containing protein [Clostridia bacterium]